MSLNVGCLRFKGSGLGRNPNTDLALADPQIHAGFCLPASPETLSLEKISRGQERKCSELDPPHIPTLNPKLRNPKPSHSQNILVCTLNPKPCFGPTEDNTSSCAFSQLRTLHAKVRPS